MNVRLPHWNELKQDEIADHVNDIAGEMQEYLNQYYDLLSERIFNVPKDKHRLEIKKEYVAKSGLWIAKKRYAQWIISNNGIPVDKLDVKGLDVVRSSFPKAFQELMSQVLIDILKGVDDKTITANIREFRDNMDNVHINDLGKNSSVKNMQKYSNEGEIGMFNFVKGTPAHVKAALSYNTLIEHWNIPYKYSRMRDGDKIKWIYLKDNPLGLESIGYFGYNDPSKLVEFIEKYADREKVFERELINKLQDFYDALGWGIVINEKETAKKFFDF